MKMDSNRLEDVSNIYPNKDHLRQMLYSEWMYNFTLVTIDRPIVKQTLNIHYIMILITRTFVFKQK